MYTFSGLLKSLLFLFCTIISQAVFSQSHRDVIYQGYITGEMDRWTAVIEEMENNMYLTPEEKEELAGYYYGYTGYLIGNNKKSANRYLKQGEKLVNDLLKVNPQNATALAMKGSFISFKIALSKMKAISLGPECMKYIKRAYKIDPGNIQALADKGNMLYYTPPLFGGNKEEALSYFEEAISRMEEAGDTTGNWFYLNLMALLYFYYQEMDMPGKAAGLKEKIQRVEPAFNWVNE